MKSKKGCLIFLGLLALGILLIPLAYLGLSALNNARREASRPVLRIFAPGLNATTPVQTDMLVQVGATAQGSPVAKLQFYADGFLAGEKSGPGETLLASWTWKAQTDGVHNLTFLAYNQQGDSEMASIQVTAIPTADRDADGVPDEQDACPDEAGPEASQGCTLEDDRDQDGIRDAEDACPDEPGEAEDGGCPPTSIPDRDRDGVPDAEDRCPDQPGLPEWDGCPAGAWVTDGDGDGLPDFLDTCPDRAGPLESDGCPSTAASDSDGDGVMDGEDTCPSEPGPADSGGCPLPTDTDGDGIADADDDCPEEAGLEESGGCMPDEGLTDTDGDGVIDAHDDCVDQPGPLENDGCPLPDDPDGDGVLGEDDNCPDQAGPESNEGCPETPLDLSDLLGVMSMSEVVSHICDIFPAICDSDGDGLTGSEDECPDQPGPSELNGCPVFPQDQDGDGVLDDQDECDTEAGEPANLGCPDSHDTDGDGLPYELDACPDQAGPADNDGCPRAGREIDVGIELLALNTDPGWVGTFCYIQATGLSMMLRIPERGLLSSAGEGSWSLPGDRRSVTLPSTEDGSLSIEVLCWGQPGDPSVLPQALGSVIRSHGYEAWDNQLRHALGSGSGGWFEIIYRMCRGECP